MMFKFFCMLGDCVWPSLDESDKHHKEEDAKHSEEKLRIEEATSNLSSKEEELKEFLIASEKLLESEHSRKSGIESRLLNTAGLVSIAGTVVLGTLFSLANEKESVGSRLATVLLTFTTFYLAVQLVAALHASLKGLQATGYTEDQPHDLLPQKGLARSVFIRKRVGHVLLRVAEHRRVNNNKLDQLKLAHRAMKNFLWGLLTVAASASLIALLRLPSSPPTDPNIAKCLASCEGAKVAPQRVSMRRILTVGPFPDGEHVLSEENVALCVTSALKLYKDLPIGGWEVVGRVDKRQLKLERAVIYGSNQALAMSRANWVAQRVLASQASFDLAHAIISIGGARGIGAAVGSSDLQSDRVVDVFGLVNSPVDEKGLSHLPEPVVCR